MERRRFLTWTFAGAATALTALIGGPIVVAFLYPTRRTIVKEGGGPIEVGKLAPLPTGTPVKVDVVTTRTDAWDRSDPQPVGAVWLVRRDDAKVDAFSDVCPHLGCPIGYDANEKVFKCPCHDSAFALSDGARLKGPAPRGLDPLPVDVVDGTVRVTHKRFVQGIAKRKEA